ncbi:MAG: hypothetical protein A2498_14055 [Lentisphaerae bacterium RIFOXYC12_FULL_60_16]|nr:MAG: hypothetical protein A2498_14055 [Lentisphaerae bacterium RIFOXYC12_FULL_60_16]OGV74616.1 MAG: hypothetical protein A2269_02275 [Lentisphaerae bacterium RIFOXYA12_FULL_60_10]OGV86430.1 MAG: hypothetical protein A2340_02880 [Lentisphaerae bacterium RIFOXYB12_FULL_60_10]
MPSKLNRLLGLGLLGIVLAGLTGCALFGNPPLNLRHHGRNIIIAADNSIRIQDQSVELGAIHNELIRQVVFRNVALTVHIHEAASPETLDAVVKELRDGQFNHIEFEVYRD